MVLSKEMFIRPKNELEGDVKVPGDVIIPCPNCKNRIYFLSEINDHLSLCPKCGYHYKIPARRRIEIMTDAKSFQEMDAQLSYTDLLEFPGYNEKLESSKTISGENESVITGTARISGEQCCVFAMEPNFMMGSMGTVCGEKITRLFEHATRQNLPVIGFTVSGGARMQEGILSLMQMAKTSGAVKYHSDAGLLYICVLQNPTTGGITASFAMEADIIIAEPGALIGFAGPRVIKQTIRQKLPEGFQTAEFVKEKGFVDLIVPRYNQKDMIAKLLRMHAGGGET
jgi:acetyl-CoA carboxylase carboxyl transferase beta subunit